MKKRNNKLAINPVKMAEKKKKKRKSGTEFNGRVKVEMDSVFFSIIPIFKPRSVWDLQNVKNVSFFFLPKLSPTSELLPPAVEWNWDALLIPAWDCVSQIYLFIHWCQAELNRFNRLEHTQVVYSIFFQPVYIYMCFCPVKFRPSTKNKQWHVNALWQKKKKK